MNPAHVIPVPDGAPRAIVGCEFSGAVRDALRRHGIDAESCDLLDTDAPGPHHVGDLLDYVRSKPRHHYALGVFFPPCTYLTVSGLHWNGRTPGRAEKTEAGLQFVRDILALPVQRLALENPVGCISTRVRKPAQTIQPYQFGADASKRTCLWLDGLPKLVPDPADRVAGRWVEWPRGSGKMVERWANQTDSGQNRLGPSADRWALRSETYPGVAEAMARFWAPVCHQPRTWAAPPPPDTIPDLLRLMTGGEPR